MRIYIRFALIAMFLVWLTPLKAQKLLMKRSDVDSSRSGFVTATFIFGIDIVTEGLDSATMVSFELVFTNIDHIYYSDYSILNFGDSSRALVQAKINPSSRTGSVNATVFSGDTIGSRGYDNPEVIHLEFVVSQAAPHGIPVTFSFNNANAVATMPDGTGAIVPLESEATVYTVNSYVTVWPGDANNDRKVNVLDYNSIALFFQSDSARKSWRSFKRKNASTKWIPQRVLSWDNDSAAYADCDGNGEITVDDLAVVRLNIDSTHYGKINKDSEILGKDIFPIVEYSPNSVRIPIRVAKTEKYVAVTGSVTLNNEEKEAFLGIESGDIFVGDGAIVFSRKDVSYVDFFVSSSDNNFGGDEGIIAYLVFKEGFPARNIEPETLKGMSPNGYFFPISSVTDVKEEQQKQWDIDLFYSNNKVFADIKESINNAKLSMYNATGGIITQNIVKEGINEIYIENMAAGAYFVVIENGLKYSVFPLLITK